MSDKHAHSDDHGHDAAAGHPPASPVGEVRLASSYTDGGHEVDYTPNKNLMVFLVVMTVLIVASALGVWQLFVSHTGTLLEEAAAQPSSQLLDQNAHDSDMATSYGAVMFDGKQVAYRVPYAEAKRTVLGTPTRFAAAAAPQGWIHPDDAGKK